MYYLHIQSIAAATLPNKLLLHGTKRSCVPLETLSFNEYFMFSVWSLRN